VRYILELDSHKVAFDFLNVGVVSIHCVFDTIPLPVDLLDDDIGFAISE
jgi:hypothetical protein